MYSEIIPWEEFVGSLIDDTGIQDIVNHYPTIRRSVYRTARDIGFGSTLLLRSRKLTVDADNKRFKLPENIVRLEDVGMCEVGFCPNTYKVQGNYLFICDDRITEFHLFYYTMLFDENANPYITANHYEAMLAGVVRTLYKPKRFDSQGNANVYAQMEQEYDDRVGEARGSDVMPTTSEEWREIGAILSMSKKEFAIYDNRKQKFCCYSDTDEIPVIDPEDPILPQNKKVHYWQITDFSFNSNDLLLLNQQEIDEKPFQNLTVFNNGYSIGWDQIGKAILAIQTSTENQFKIFDFFNQDITDTFFDKIYNATLEVDFYISKYPITISSIYYKII